VPVTIRLLKAVTWIAAFRLCGKIRTGLRCFPQQAMPAQSPVIFPAPTRRNADSSGLHLIALLHDSALTSRYGVARPVHWGRRFFASAADRPRADSGVPATTSACPSGMPFSPQNNCFFNATVAISATTRGLRSNRHSTIPPARKPVWPLRDTADG